MGTNYYVRTPACANACEHCAQSELVHLGKTSAGWRFGFQARPDWPPTEAYDRWLTLATSGPIEDEYGRPLTIDELLAMIEERRSLRSRLATHPDLGIYQAHLDGKFECAGHDFNIRDFT